MHIPFPDRELRQKIYVILLPIALQNLLMNVDVVIDSVMLGQISQSALASVSLAGQVQFIYGMLMGSFAGGVAIFMSQYWGRRDTRTIEKLLGQTIQISMAISAVFFLLTFFFPRQSMRIFTDVPEFLELGSGYLRILAISYFLLALNTALSTSCRSTGHTRELFLISLVTVPLDILFNYLFIYGVRGHFAFGVPGAATATVLVRLLSLGMIWWEFRREGLFRIRWFYLRNFSGSLFRYVAKYIWPIFGNCVCYGIGITVASIVIGHQTPDAVAANSVLRLIAGAASIFFIGTYSGVSIIVGNLLGAGKLAEAKRADQQLFTVSVLGGCLSSLVLLLAIPCVHWFAKLTPEATQLARWMLVLFVPSMLAKSCNSLFFASFNTGGESRISFRLDLTMTIGIIVPAGLLLGLVVRAPILLVFFVVYADEILKAPAALWFYRKYTWVRDLTACRKNRTNV